MHTNITSTYAPERHECLAGIMCSLVCFILIPFLTEVLLIVPLEYFGDTLYVRSWVDIVFHIVNFCIAIFPFRDHLKDCRLMLMVDRTLVFQILAAVGISLFYFIGLYVVSVYSQLDFLAYLPDYALPLTELDYLIFASSLVIENPIFGTLTLAIFPPVTVACLLYLSVFAPLCDSKPVLAYLAVAAVSALPFLGLLIYGADILTELIFFLSRLPIHLLACWLFKKTDTIFAPIAMHMCNNLIACLFYIVLFR